MILPAPWFTLRDFMQELVVSLHPAERVVQFNIDGQAFDATMPAVDQSIRFRAGASVWIFVQRMVLPLYVHLSTGGMLRMELTTSTKGPNHFMEQVDMKLPWMSVESTYLEMCEAPSAGPDGRLPSSLEEAPLALREIWEATSRNPHLFVLGSVKLPTVTYTMSGLERTFHVSMGADVTKSAAVSAALNCAYNPSPATVLNVMVGGENLLAGNHPGEVLNTADLRLVVDLNETVTSVMLSVLGTYSDTAWMPAMCTGEVIHIYIRQMFAQFGEDICVLTKRGQKVKPDDTVFVLRGENLEVTGEGVAGGISIRPATTSSRPFNTLELAHGETYATLRAKIDAAVSTSTVVFAEPPAIWYNGRIFPDHLRMTLFPADTPAFIVAQPHKKLTANIYGLKEADEWVTVSDFPANTTVFAFNRYFYKHPLFAHRKESNLITSVIVDDVEVPRAPPGLSLQFSGTPNVQFVAEPY